MKQQIPVQYNVLKSYTNSPFVGRSTPTMASSFVGTMSTSDSEDDPESMFSRKPLDATVDRGTVATLFAQEAEYYQDITVSAANAQKSYRMIVDVLDTLSIGAGTPIPGNESESVRVFTETLVVSHFKAKSVLLACNTLSGVKDSNVSCITVSPVSKPDFDTEQIKGPGGTGARGDDAGDIFVFVESIDEANPATFPLLDARVFLSNRNRVK